MALRPCIADSSQEAGHAECPKSTTRSTGIARARWLCSMWPRADATTEAGMSSWHGGPAGACWICPWSRAILPVQQNMLRILDPTLSLLGARDALSNPRMPCKASAETKKARKCALALTKLSGWFLVRAPSLHQLRVQHMRLEQHTQGISQSQKSAALASH